MLLIFWKGVQDRPEKNTATANQITILNITLSVQFNMLK